MSQPASFRLTAAPADGDVAHLIMALDTQAKQPGVRLLRDWARAALAAHPGERAVDIGSGTGEELQALADAVGAGGEAVGVDPIPGLLAEATRRAAESGSSARFVAGDAYSLPFEESTVDVVRCERVLQHLEEPERAVAEIARVLRPGGRVALLDSDWGTTIMHPGDPATIQSLERFWLGRSANPFSGRRLAGQLTAVGLEVVDRGSQALIQTPDVIDTLLAMIGALAVEQGAITEAQRAALQADLEDAAVRGDFHFSVTMFGVLGRKP
jgi:ubiquinone/menaquinone biosynthesis C-methylase UbiE